MNTHGVWSATVKKDLDGVAYQFRVYHEESFYQDTRDPYSIALSLDNKKSLVVNPQRLVPRGYEKVTKQKASWRAHPLSVKCTSVISQSQRRLVLRSPIEEPIWVLVRKGLEMPMEM